MLPPPQQRSALLKTTTVALRDARQQYLDTVAKLHELSERIATLEDQLARLTDKLRPLATTYACIASSINRKTYAVEKCSCSPLNVLDCHVNDTATGCAGSCHKSANDARSFELMNRARQSLEESFVATSTDLRAMTERYTLLQNLASGTDANAGAPPVEDKEALDVQLKALASSAETLKREREITHRALKAVYTSLAEMPTAAAQCSPSLVHPGSGRVLQCGCTDPSKPCRPDATRQACEQQCPALPPLDPKAGCYLRRDSRRAGQPGADAEGNYCDGRCTEGLTSTCMPVLSESGAIRGCQCQTADVVLPEESTSERHCLPEKTEGDFVFSCGCQGACRVLRDPAKSGQTAEGYDYQGLYCSGELGLVRWK